MTGSETPDRQPNGCLVTPREPPQPAAEPSQLVRRSDREPRSISARSVDSLRRNGSTSFAADELAPAEGLPEWTALVCVTWRSARAPRSPRPRSAALAPKAHDHASAGTSPPAGASESRTGGPITHASAGAHDHRRALLPDGVALRPSAPLPAFTPGAGGRGPHAAGAARAGGQCRRLGWARCKADGGGGAQDWPPVGCPARAAVTASVRAGVTDFGQGTPSIPTDRRLHLGSAVSRAG